MLRDLLKEGGLYTLVSLLTRGVNLFLIPFYTEYFSPQDYGILDIITIFTLIISNIFSLQMNQGMARYVGEPKEGNLSKIAYTSTAVWFSNGVLLVISVILVLFPELFINILSEDVKIPKSTFRLAILTMFLTGVFYLFNVQLRFMRKVKVITLLSLTHALIGTGLIIYLILYNGRSIESIYISYSFVLPFLILFQVYVLKDQLAFQFNTKRLKKMLSFSLPLIPASIAVILMNFADRIYIKELMDFNSLGIYAMAAKFASIITMIIGGFQMAIGPLILEKQYSVSTKMELNKMLRIFIAVGGAGVIALSFFSKEFVHLFTNSRFHDASNIMPILYLSTFFAGFAMFSQGLLIKKKTGISAIIVIFFSVLNIGLNALFIPVWGLYGAAFATLISLASHQTSLFLISQRYYRFPLSFERSSITLFLMIGLITLIIFWNPELNLVNFFIKGAILLAFIVFCFSIKLVNLNLILKFFKRQNL